MVKVAPHIPLWDPAEDTELQVTEYDRSHNVATAPSVAWFCEGDINAAARLLQVRVAEILTANPWLAACYTRDKKWMYPRALATDTLPAALLARHFTQGSENLVICDHAYFATFKTLRPYLCLNAKEIRGTEGSAFRVSLVQDAGSDSEGCGRFALVLSVNHVLADGATMYTLASMLTEGEDRIRALVAKRPQGFSEVQEKVVGAAEAGMFSFKHAGFNLGLIGAVLGDAWRGKKRDLLITEVDETWLEERKREAAAAVGLPYVSTNDVLTSLVLSELVPARVGLMEVNLRGRVPTLLPATATSAGNYTVFAPFFYGDASSPSDVRRSLRSDGAHFAARRHTGSPLPGFCGMLCGPGRYVAVSNWASLDLTPMALPGCKTLYHLPMMEMLVPSPFDGSCIWRPAPGRVGLLVMCRKRGLLPSAHRALGQRVMNFTTSVERDAHKASVRSM